MSRAAVYPSTQSAPPKGAYYSVKDQPLPAPSTYRGRKRRSCHPCCCVLGTLCIALLVIITAIGLFALAFWLLVHPKLPHYNVTNVRITGLVPASPQNATMSTETLFTVEARNPNKKVGIYYEKIKVHIESLGLTIGNSYLTPFYQGHKNTTYIVGDITSGPLNVADVSNAGLLAADTAGKVPLYLKVDVRARIKVGRFKSPKFYVKVRCNINVNPNIEGTRSQLLDQSCSVKGGR